MTTTYPEGTRWAVVSYKADRGKDCERQWVEHVSDNQLIHTLDVSRRHPTIRVAAMKRLWDCREWHVRRSNPSHGTTYRLVRIPPPRPKPRTVLSVLSGILCDAGDVPVDPVTEGVRVLVRQRDGARSDLAMVHAALDAAWAATGVADRVRGLTTLDDVIATLRASEEERISEAVRERTEVILFALPARTLQQAQYLRDLRDGKVGA